MAAPQGPTSQRRGIIAAGAHLPHHRLDRSTIAAIAGGGGGRGTRTVACYDEDATTLAVAAARTCLAGTDVRPAGLWFTTTTPPYADKTNATAVHAALGLDRSAAALDLGGAARSAVGSLWAALSGAAPTLVVAADVRPGLPGSADEVAAGDAAAALLVGEEADGPVRAELIAGASVTEEILERWRTPGDARTRTWEERFGEAQYVPLGVEAVTAALASARIGAGEVDHLIVASPNGRAARAVVAKLGLPAAAIADDLADTVGNPGAAQLGLLLTAALERAEPDQVIVALSLADGADGLVLRTTDSVTGARAARSVAEQVGSGAPVDYGTYLRWRGHLPVEPPRRPEPARPSGSAAARNADWKFGLVASRDRSGGGVHMPPSRAAMHGGAIDEMDPVAMADAVGTVVTSTVDRLAYSPSPPIVFAVVDFDSGGRLPVELTDCRPDEVAIGVRVEMTFRRLFTADGIHNYFWKARPLRTASGGVETVRTERAGGV